MGKPRSRACFICNEKMEPVRLEQPGLAVGWANDPVADSASNLWLVFAHPACIERVAHPDYNLDRHRGKLTE